LRSIIINDGAPLWILGFKTERPILAVDNRNGATTDIVGALFCMVSPLARRYYFAAPTPR